MTLPVHPQHQRSVIQEHHNNGLFYDEGMPQHGLWWDDSYGGGPPGYVDDNALSTSVL